MPCAGLTAGTRTQTSALRKHSTHLGGRGAVPQAAHKEYGLGASHTSRESGLTGDSLGAFQRLAQGCTSSTKHHVLHLKNTR